MIKVAFQMEPLAECNPANSTTFLLLDQALERKYRVYHYEPQDLFFKDGKILARATKIRRSKKYKNKLLNSKEVSIINLAKIDAVMMRQDPPFNMQYITCCMLLEQLKGKTLVVNDPFSVRNLPEKLYPLQFPQYTPPTLITSDKREIIKFRKQYKSIIMKPMYAFGGRGVFHIRPDDENLSNAFDYMVGKTTEPIIVQKYIKEIVDGDKRAIFIDGKLKGYFKRIPPKGELRTSPTVGGKLVFDEPSKKDLEICEAVAADLKKKGIFLGAIDIIGEYLTEINSTSPSGLMYIKNEKGINLAEDFWDAVEKKF